MTILSRIELKLSGETFQQPHSPSVSEAGKGVFMVRSPIEMMVDRACGFDPNAPSKPTVLLYCPKCKRRQRASVDDTDPPRTATVIIQCPKCVGGDFDSPKYQDASGKELFYEEKE